jgi:hypothetical protein
MLAGAGVWAAQFATLAPTATITAPTPASASAFQVSLIVILLTHPRSLALS